MTQFREFQEQFQRAILDGDPAVLGEISEGAREKGAVLFDVYRKAYIDRLVKFLRGDHELLHAYLGEEKFNALAQACIHANPARDPYPRRYASHLPWFLRETEPYSANPELAELALLEESLKDAYYAPNAPVLHLSEIAGIPPEKWGELQFRSHPSATRLDLVTNASAIWMALKSRQKRPAATRLQTDEPILVWRQTDIGVFRVLSAGEAIMWDLAVKGVRFGVMCEMLATRNPTDQPATRAATYLRSWIGAGLLTSATASSDGSG